MPDWGRPRDQTVAIDDGDVVVEPLGKHQRATPGGTTVKGAWNTSGVSRLGSTGAADKGPPSPPRNSHRRRAQPLAPTPTLQRRPSLPFHRDRERRPSR